MITGVRIHGSLPTGWHSYTATEVAKPSWRSTVPPAEDGSAYTAQLARFEEWVAAQGTARVAWLLVLNPVELEPGVVAFGSIDVRPGPALDVIQAQVEAAPIPAHVMSRTVSRTTVAGHELLLCHEMGARGHGSTGAHLEERGLAIRHDTEGEVNVAVDLITTDLSGFEEIAGSAGHVCAGVDVRVEGSVR